MANFNRIKNVVSVIMVSAVLTASAYAEEIKLSTVVGGPPKMLSGTIPVKIYTGNNPDWLTANYSFPAGYFNTTPSVMVTPVCYSGHNTLRWYLQTNGNIGFSVYLCSWWFDSSGWMGNYQTGSDAGGTYYLINFAWLAIGS